MLKPIHSRRHACSSLTCSSSDADGGCSGARRAGRARAAMLQTPMINRGFWRFTATQSAPQIDSRPIAGHGTDSGPNLAREAGTGFPGGFLRGSIWRRRQQRVRRSRLVRLAEVSVRQFLLQRHRDSLPAGSAHQQRQNGTESQGGGDRTRPLTRATNQFPDSREEGRPVIISATAAKSPKSSRQRSRNSFSAPASHSAKPRRGLPIRGSGQNSSRPPRRMVPHRNRTGGSAEAPRNAGRTGLTSPNSARVRRSAVGIP
jgi:hypothetical protein